MRGDGARQRAAGAVQIARRQTRRRETMRAVGRDQPIDAFGVLRGGRLSSAPPPVRKLAMRLALGSISVSDAAATARERNAAASSRLGVMRSTSGSSSRSAVQESGARQRVARRGRHHRIVDDERSCFAPPQAVRDRSDDVRGCKHADLHRADVEIVEHRFDLRRDHLRRRGQERAHAKGVLRGQRGDRRRAVDADRGKSLEVGLDAGAAPESEPAMLSAVFRRLTAASASPRSILSRALPDPRSR